MASTKSNGERNYFKAVSNSAYSGSKVTVNTRSLKNVRSQRMLKQRNNETKTVKSIRTVKTADIVNLINGQKLADQVGLKLGTEENNEN